MAKGGFRGSLNVSMWNRNRKYTLHLNCVNMWKLSLWTKLNEITFVSLRACFLQWINPGICHLQKYIICSTLWANSQWLFWALEVHFFEGGVICRDVPNKSEQLNWRALPEVHYRRKHAMVTSQKWFPLEISSVRRLHRLQKWKRVNLICL